MLCQMGGRHSLTKQKCRVSFRRGGGGTPNSGGKAAVACVVVAVIEVTGAVNAKVVKVSVELPNGKTTKGMAKVADLRE